jgi:hypothetical protein
VSMRTVAETNFLGEALGEMGVVNSPMHLGKEHAQVSTCRIRVKNGSHSR